MPVRLPGAQLPAADRGAADRRPRRHRPPVARHPARRRHQHGARRRRHRLEPAVAAAAGGAGRGDGRAVLDLYQVWNDPVQPDGFEARGMPTAAAKLRWPLVRTTARAEHVIEPIAQVDLLRLPRRDRRAERGQPAARVRRDQPLLAQPLPRRGPAGDRAARQPRRSATRATTPAGWSVGATLGRVIRAESAAVLPRRRRHPRAAGPTTSARSTSTSAPASRRSTARSSAPSSTSGATSSRSPGTRRPRRAAGRPTSTSPRSRTTLSSGPQPTTSELSLDARYRVHPNWEVRGLWRYDLEQRQQPARRRRHQLRQRVRRVRPFDLTPLHLIG